MAEYMATASIDLAASPDRVWEALTDPKQVKEYFFETNVESDWRKGSTIRWRGEWQGKTYEDRGTVLEVQPGRYLQCTYWSALSGKPDEPQNYIQVEYILEPTAGGTKLSIIQEADSLEGAEHSQENWNIVLEQLQEYLESNA